MEDYRPDPRRYTVDLSGGNPSAAVRWGDNHPSLMGWDIAWIMRHGSNGALVNAIWHGRQDWYQGRFIEYGDQNTGCMMTQAGRVFMPYSTISLQLFDTNGVGNVSCQVIGRPVLCGEVPLGNSCLYGVQEFSADASGSTTVSVPENANMFAVGRSEATAEPIQIEAIGLTDKVFWTFVQNDQSTQIGTISRTPWHECPPADKSGTGSIKITNGDGGNAVSGFIWFRFDFNQGR